MKKQIFFSAVKKNKKNLASIYRGLGHPLLDRHHKLISRKKPKAFQNIATKPSNAWLKVFIAIYLKSTIHST